MTREHIQRLQRRDRDHSDIMQSLFPSFSAAAVQIPDLPSTMAFLYASQDTAAFLDAGIQLLPGTDAGGYQAHGHLAKSWFVDINGAKRWEIIDLATWKARDTWAYPDYQMVPTRTWSSLTRSARRHHR